MPMSADLGTVEDQRFAISNFRLQDGTVMGEAKIANETHGRLAANGKNAVLITHGYTSSHHAAGRSPANGNLPGWWDGLIGFGKAIDTDKLFVVFSNMLGSSSGSTNGASINPQTGKPYGPDLSGDNRARYRDDGEITARSAWRQASRRHRRPVLWRLSDISVGRRLAGLHRWHCPGGNRAQGAEC